MLSSQISLVTKIVTKLWLTYIVAISSQDVTNTKVIKKSKLPTNYSVTKSLDYATAITSQARHWLWWKFSLKLLLQNKDSCFRCWSPAHLFWGGVRLVMFLRFGVVFILSCMLGFPLLRTRRRLLFGSS